MTAEPRPVTAVLPAHVRAALWREWALLVLAPRPDAPEPADPEGDPVVTEPTAEAWAAMTPAERLRNVAVRFAERRRLRQRPLTEEALRKRPRYRPGRRRGPAGPARPPGDGR